MKFTKKILLALSIFAAGCTVHTAENPIRIGAMGPLTGAAVSYGHPVQNAIDLYVEQINEAGGVNGQPLQVLWQDAECSQRGAEAAAEHLMLAQNVPVVMGGVCSSETLAAAPLANENEVVLITPISKSPAITNAGEYVFRLNVNSDTFGQVSAPWANDRYANMSTMTEQTAFALGTQNSLINRFNGVKDINEFPSTETSFAALVQKMAATNNEVLMINVQTIDKFQLILKAMNEAEYAPELIINELLSGSPQVVAQLETYSNKVTSVLFQAPENDRMKALSTAYEAKYGEAPSYADALIFPIDTLDMLVSILEKNPDATGTELQKAIAKYEMKEGMAGDYAFDKNGEANLLPQLVEYKNGVFGPASAA